MYKQRYFRPEVMPPQKKRQDQEHQLQREICTFLDNQSMTVPMEYFAVPNALKFLSSLRNTHRIAAAYNKMRAEGFKDGVSDIVVIAQWQGRLKIGFFEQKSPAVYRISEKTGRRIIHTAEGRPTPAQLRFLQAVTRLGAYGAVSRTLEEFRTHWDDFLNS